MASVWGIHGRRPVFEMVRDHVIELERAGIGDLQLLGDDRSRVERALRGSYPNEKDGTIRNWTTVLLRFAFGPTLGDIVVHPDPRTRTVSAGRIIGDYRFLAQGRELHRRAAEWFVTRVPRDDLSDAARADLSQRPAFFELSSAGEEFRALAGQSHRPG